jgi:hypothetical protein
MSHMPSFVILTLAGGTVIGREAKNTWIGSAIIDGD